MNYLLIFPIIFPILSGTLVTLIGFKNRKARNIYILAASLINSFLILLVLLNADKIGSLHFLNISKGLPLALSADGMSRIFASLIALLWPIAVCYAIEYMEHEGGENVFYTFYLITYGITTGLAFSDNLLTLYLFYEFLTLVTLPIVMHGMKEKNIAAGRKYVLYSIGGAAFAFIGMVVALNYAGSTEFVYGGLFTDILGTEEADVMRFIFVLTFFGFGVKAAIFPLHGWLPTASVAPTPVTALLHAVAVVNCGAFAIIRIIYFIFGTELLYGTWAQEVCLIMTIVTIIYGSSMALKEQHFKKRLAYSTISNLSYMLFGAALMTPEGLTGSLSHFVFHGIIKITLFFVAGIVLCKYEKMYVDELYGFGRRMKITFAAFVIAGLGLMGVPPTIGFASKWQLITGAAGSHTVTATIGIIAILISAVLTSIYIFSLVFRAYFPGSGFKTDTIAEVKDPGPFMTVPLIILSVLIIVMGIFSEPIVDHIYKVASASLKF